MKWPWTLVQFQRQTQVTNAMTEWMASCGDLLDATADALICSANPQLNLSGGVGGAFGLRYGNGMQAYLHQWLASHNRPYIDPGEVVVAPSCGSPFRVVVHAAAIDAFYDTSAEVIRVAYENAFAAIADSDCRNVAAACLACGYGRASIEMFLAAIRPLFHQTLRGIDRIAFVSRDSELVGAIQGEFCLRNDV